MEVPFWERLRRAVTAGFISHGEVVNRRRIREVQGLPLGEVNAADRGFLEALLSVPVTTRSLGTLKRLVAAAKRAEK